MGIWINFSHQVKPFENLTIIELASVLAGPSVGLFFAELGAKVIKIENKNSGGDVTRSWKLATEDDAHPYSAYYSSINAGKETLFLDLKNTSDFQQLSMLIADADVLIANFKPGDAEKLRLDYHSIKTINPTIVYGEITGFGKVQRTAYDVVLQAESGFLSMNGTVEGTLCKMPVALIDILAAHHLKEGLLVALLQQKEKKTAFHVSVSLYETALASLANQATNWLMAKHIAKPMGTLHPNIAPYGELFQCKDQKQVVLAIGTNKQFQNLCSILKIDHLSKDERFKSNQDRVKNRETLAKLLAIQISSYNRSQLMSWLIEEGVPAGAVRNMKEVFDLPEAQQLLKHSTKEGKKMLSVRSNAFHIQS